jgi:hypothetical protein
MPRRKLARRFEPTCGATGAMIEEEAKWLLREIEDCQILSAGEVNKTLAERHDKCVQSWEHLQLLLTALRKREQHAIQCLLFGDFFHILEVYVHHVRSTHSESAAPTLHAVHPPKTETKFSEWLFGP